jgi:hypothetical protein
MGQPINRSIELLLGAVEDAGGGRLETSKFLGCLIRRVEDAGITEAPLAIAMGYHRMKRSYSRALNLALARGVSRWALHALGPDTPLTKSYPFYRALAIARDVEPWSFVWFQSHCYTSGNQQLAKRKTLEVTA